MERFETFDDSSVDFYDHDEDDSSVEGPRAVFEFFDDDDVDFTVDPVPDPADLVDRDGNPIHQPSIDRMLAYLAGKDDDDDEEAHDLLDNVQLIHWWPEPSFRDVVEKARASQRAKVALRPGLLRNLLSAERASEIVSSLSKLTTLQLQDHDERDFRDEGRERQDASYVSHFLRRLAATERPGAPRLSHLELTADCPMDPSHLRVLFSRHARTLEFAKLACPRDRFLTQSVADALQRGLGSLYLLRDLDLDLYANKFTPNVLIGLIMTLRLERLLLTFEFWELYCRDNDSGDGDTSYWDAQQEQGMSNSAIFRRAVEILVDVVETKSYLRQFEFKCMGHASQCKHTFRGISLLEALVSNEVLEDLSLKSIHLGTDTKLTREPGRRNTSLTKVRLEKCVMGHDAFALLSECVAITSIEMHGCEDLPRYESWNALLQATSGLRTFTMKHREGRGCWPEVENHGAVRALVDASPTLQSLDLDLGDIFTASNVRFGSIQQLIVARAGSLKLKLCVDQNPKPVFVGIRSTRTLTRLDLHLSYYATAAISSFASNTSFQWPTHCVCTALSSIARNASLKWLSLCLEMEVRNFYPFPCQYDFTAMIRDNSTLEFLAFQVCGSEWNHPTRVEALEAFLPALVEDLKHNRTLRTIHLGEKIKLRVSETISRSLVEVLQRPNIRLKWIKGLSYESAEDERAIERLCVTRHARMVVDDPDAYSPLLMPRILSRLSMDGPDCVRYFLTHISRDFLGHVVPKRGTRRARSVNG